MIAIQQFVAQIIVLCHCALHISESVPDHRPDHNCSFQSSPLRLTHTHPHTQRTGQEVLLQREGSEEKAEIISEKLQGDDQETEPVGQIWAEKEKT